MRILLIDDDELLAQTLANNLVAQHYAVDVVTDGQTGWDYAEAATYDLIVLDVNLPKIDGISLCQRLRRNKYKGPILLLTAKGGSSDKVMGLDAGADDYVVKPCTVEELSARIRALLRRQQASSSPILEWGNLRLDPSTCEVTYNGQDVTLSAKEYGLLELFLRHPQRVYSSSSILEHLWGFEDAPGEETVRTHIKRLRRKLKSTGAEDVIETVYGMGYRLNPLPDKASTSAEQARSVALSSWEHFKVPSLERVAVLDQAIAALQSGNLPEELRCQAEQAAHKLAGSLGMFGFPEGSRVARNIEQWLQSSATKEVTSLTPLVAALRQELHQAPKSPDDEDWLSSLEEAASSQRQKRQLPTRSSEQPASNRVLPAEIRVLVVDDDRTVLDLLNQYLPRWGIHLTLLEDPRHIWQELETNPPDLLILDIEMPYINGIELCQLIRRDHTWDGLPILFLSARRDVDTVHRLYSAGADDYIAKPFTEPEVVTRIFNRLERNRLLRNLGQGDA